MTVQEMITLLEKYDPEADVLVDQGLCKSARVTLLNGNSKEVLITH